jgi:hypothetical protein
MLCKRSNLSAIINSVNFRKMIIYPALVIQADQPWKGMVVIVLYLLHHRFAHLHRHRGGHCAGWSHPCLRGYCGGYLPEDVAQVEAKITPRTKAILPIHLYGQTVDMDPLLHIASRHHLKVIEDTCQAHGATYKIRRAGSLGYAAAFSFYYSKNLGAFGEGGFITTSDPEIAHKARMIRDHGSERRYYHDLIGFNGRLDETQAVVLRDKLPHLTEYNRLRITNQFFISLPDKSSTCEEEL